MKNPMTFLVLLFFPLLIETKKTKNTIYLPLVYVNRANYFDTKVLSPPLVSPQRYQGVAFTAIIHLGSPGVQQYLHVDTGSTLSWNHCFPCSNCVTEPIYPKYRPRDSTTYRDAKCKTTTGQNPKFTYSYWSGKCSYVGIYADGCLIRGTLGKDTIALATLEGGFEDVDDFYFGCNDQALGGDFIGTGILGLGLGKYSLVEKLGSKFSLCFGSEPKSNHSLILGDGAYLQGQPTVIILDGGHYMFQLEYIFVGENGTLYEPIQVYLDTGSSISHMPDYIYKHIVENVRKIIGGSLKLVQYEPMLCYKASAQEIPDHIEISFVFSGGAELSMNARNIFLPNGPGKLCLAIRKNAPNDDEIIIGFVAMQGYNLGYDVKAKKVYIQKRNCNM